MKEPIEKLRMMYKKEVDLLKEMGAAYREGKLMYTSDIDRQFEIVNVITNAIFFKSQKEK